MSGGALRLVRLRPGNIASFAPYIPGNMLEEALSCGVGAIYLGRAAGAAAAVAERDGSWRLLCLFVDPALRRRGLGAYILRGLMGVASSEGGRRMYFICPKEEMSGVGGCLADAGFSPAQGCGTEFALPYEDLLKLRIFKAPAPEGYLTPFTAFTPAQRAAYALAKGSFPPGLERDEAKGRVLEQASGVRFNGAGGVAGFVVCTEFGDDLWLYSLYAGDGGDSLFTLYAARWAVAHLPVDRAKTVRTTAVTPGSEAFCRRFLTGAQTIELERREAAL